MLQTGKEKAIILAAGLGSRLGQKTEHKPKALVEWEGAPLIDHVIQKLKAAGFTDVIINVHHHAEMIMAHVEKMGRFGITIEFSHEKEELLDTGGGISENMLCQALKLAVGLARLKCRNPLSSIPPNTGLRPQ